LTRMKPSRLSSYVSSFFYALSCTVCSLIGEGICLYYTNHLTIITHIDTPSIEAGTKARAIPVIKDILIPSMRKQDRLGAFTTQHFVVTSKPAVPLRQRSSARCRSTILKLGGLVWQAHARPYFP